VIIFSAQAFNFDSEEENTLYGVYGKVIGERSNHILASGRGE